MSPRSSAGAPLVTGSGAVTGAGLGVPALWQLVADGHSAIRRVDDGGWDGELADALVAKVPGNGGVLDFAIAAAREALAGRCELDRHRGALVLGTTAGSDRDDIGRLVFDLALVLGLEGPRITVSTACCSSTAAIGLASDLVARGVVPWALAGGAEEITPELYAGFAALAALAPERCAPLSTTMGLSLGEGAGFVLVEPGGAGAGDDDEVAILGSGLACDAHHATAPHPRGRGVAAALRGALRARRLAPESLDYVNLHGTGTSANDGAECLGVAAALGPHAEGMPASSTKGHLGHAQGAAGALELIATLEGRRHGLLPPTLGCEVPRPRLRIDPVPGAEPRPSRFDRFASLNAAFGGANAALVLGASRLALAPCAPTGRAVYLHRVATVDPLPGPELEALSRRHLRRVPPGRLDRAATLLSLAAAEAVRGTRGRPDHRGIFLGVDACTPSSQRAFRESIERRGLLRASAPAFARMVAHAPAGEAARALDLRGPMTSVSLGVASGLLAIAQAADWLAHRDDETTCMVAGTVEEARGAVVVALASEPPGEGPAIRVSGWSLEGPGAVGAAPAAARWEAERALVSEVAELRAAKKESGTVSAFDSRFGRVTVHLEVEGAVEEGNRCEQR